jgi:hypothetical protein
MTGRDGEGGLAEDGICVVSVVDPTAPRVCHSRSSAGILYAPVRAQQDRIRRDHRAAQVRRLARLRARRRCEDLAELLGQMALRPRDPDQTADLLRRSLVAAREIERLVTGACGARPRPWQPQEITSQTLSCLEQMVEHLDDAIRDAPLAAEAGDAEARCLAAELATTLAGGVEGLVATRTRR